MSYAFTEHGVAMLSSILNSEKAIETNILIIKAFIRLHQIVSDNTEVHKAITNIERRLNVHDRQIQIAFDALKGLLQPKAAPKEIPVKEYSPDENKRMGFKKDK